MAPSSQAVPHCWASHPGPPGRAWNKLVRCPSWGAGGGWAAVSPATCPPLAEPTPPPAPTPPAAPAPRPAPAPLAAPAPPPALTAHQLRQGQMAPGRPAEVKLSVDLAHMTSPLLLCRKELGHKSRPLWPPAPHHRPLPRPSQFLAEGQGLRGSASDECPAGKALRPRPGRWRPLPVSECSSDRYYGHLCRELGRHEGV